LSHSVVTSGWVVGRGLLPGAVGLLGLVLVRRASRVGGVLVLAYCVFWCVVLGSLVPRAWQDTWVEGLTVQPRRDPDKLV
jgi:hypothetical protein